MRESIFTIPKRIDANSLGDYLKEYNDWHTTSFVAERICIDLKQCDFMSPIALNHLMSVTDEFKMKGKEVVARFGETPKGMSKIMTYFGFFNSDSALDEAPFLQDYLVPIQRIENAKQLIAAVNSIGKLIVEKTKCSLANRAATEWLINEIADNSGTHGYGNYANEDYYKNYERPVYLSAFSFKDNVEIAILDTGVGILRSLQTKHQVDNGKDALRMAIKQGVSGHPFGSPGFGLYGASEICRKDGGRLSIWSSDAMLKVQGGNVQVFNSPFNRGTAVCFEVGMNMETALKEVLGRDVEEFGDEFWS